MSLEMLPLFAAAIFILAALPGPGVLLTVARAINGGIYHASFTVTGILLGDIVFIILVTFGLKFIAESLTTLFILIKYAGGLYLIWLGLNLLLSKPQKINLKAEATLRQKNKMTVIADIAAGLTVTLSNPKAIVFYLSFLPAFMDLQALKTVDIIVITATVIIVLGSVMMGYAIAAIKAQKMVKANQSDKWIKKIAGGLILSTGSWLIVRQ